MLFTSRDVEVVGAVITVSTPRGIYQLRSKIQANHEGISGKMINFLLSRDFDDADGRRNRTASMEKMYESPQATGCLSGMRQPGLAAIS